MEKAKEKGAKKAIELKTSGPFHTKKLEKASDKLKLELDKIEINYKEENKVIKNMDAKAYSKNDDIREILAKHVMSPVYFSKSIEEMIEKSGVDTFIEIGPRKNFIKFCKKNKQRCESVKYN
jgi:[acyl-carrier-protein] S-malonyltransferase